MNEALPRLLIVDDAPANIALLADGLASEYDIRFATSGAEALRLVEMQRPDMILLDVMMPGMDGYAVCAELKARPDTAEIPVIFVTAAGDTDDVVRGLELGADDYLTKPIDLSIARARLRNLLQRRSAEERLRDSETRLRAITESAQDAILMMDPDEAVSFWNPAAETIFGYRSEEALGRNLHRLLAPPECLDAYRQGFDAFIQSGCGRVIGTTRELTARRKDGRTITISLSLSAISLDGRWHAVGIVRDVTRQKQAEEALRRSEEKFSRAFAASPDGLVISRRRDGKIIEVNDSWVRQFGFTKQEAVGRPIGDLGFYRDPADRERLLQQLARDGVVSNREIAFRRKSGEVRHVLLSSQQIEIDGEPCLLSILHDVTEQKAAEEQIRRLSVAVEQSPESIVITDLDARIEYVNEAFVRCTGYTREQALGKNPRILHSGKTPKSTYEELWSTLTRGETWRGEFYNCRKDGSEYVEAAIVAPIRQPDGSIRHYLAIKEDITERKRMEQELERHRHHLEELVAERTVELEVAKEAAEAANRAKSSFLANMSHEIRTPMNAILGLGYLLKRSGLEPEQGERLDRLEGAARHLLTIIDDILDISRIEAGKWSLQEVDFRPEDLFGELRAMVGDKAAAKGLGLHFTAEGLPPVLRGDATRLRQALLNYLGNAIKFSEHGDVTLRAEVADASGQELLVRYTVADAGIGIPAEQLARLFVPFEQGDPSTTRKYGGTGLGLAITRGLAEMMGGSAGVESVPGRGSTFWLTVRLKTGREPIAAANAPAEAAPIGTADRWFDRQVLLAEDNPINRAVTLELLRDYGVSVDVAEDGRIAVQKARDCVYHLILMDVQMPEMSGLDATRAIRSLPGREAVPIVAMTANAFDEDRRLCLDAGMNDFVAKPIQPEVLHAVLSRWLSAAVPPEGADFRRRLEAVPGLDVGSGLRVVQGKLGTYRRLLDMFVQHHADDGLRLRGCLDADDLVQAQQLAHALKGVAGNLGAMAVYRAAEALCTAIRQREDRAVIDGHCDALVAALQPLLEALRAIPADR